MYGSSARSITRLVPPLGCSCASGSEGDKTAWDVAVPLPAVAADQDEAPA
jgi:hypothetical protein